MQRLPYAVLAVGVLAVSSASILVRYAQAAGMAELGIAAYRLLFAALLLTPFAVRPGVRALRSFGFADRIRIGAAGVCLAIHFAAWICSLAYTSVASSMALVSSHPLWIAIAVYVVFGERLGNLALSGIVLTVAGAAAILWSDQTAGLGSAPLLGNALAILGAVSVAAYILLARALRDAIGMLAYIWIVYGIAALALMLGAAGSGALTANVSVLGLAFVLAMAIGPQLVGHTSINYAARHLTPTLVSVAILGEPVLSAALAWALLGEDVAPLQLCGFAATLCGILLCALDARGSAADARSPAA
jgi:drug/metabolite transporter (DMT)-like permease